MSLDEKWWVPALGQGAKAAYLDIAECIARDRDSGRLRPQERLPPQRWLADRLGLNFSTVSRGYIEAQRRGLIDSRVGQGSFVRPAAPICEADLPPSAELGMNLPPEPVDMELNARMSASLAELTRRQDLRQLLRYRDFGGSAIDRAAGQRWLSARLPEVAAADVLVCAGAQAALLALLTALTRSGDTICCEALAYPGLRSLAAHLGLVLRGLPMDADGPLPEALEAAGASGIIKALYLNPTLQNPTGRTISEARRHQLVEIARRYDLPIIEDDAYGALIDTAPPALATLAPERVFHVSGLAKCLGGGLRIAYLKVPGLAWRARIAAALRATSLMASPITAGLASLWINEGLAFEVLDEVRRESRSRRAEATRLLPASCIGGGAEAFHLWLTLPAGWSRVSFLSAAQGLGIGMAPSDAFDVTGQPPEALRLCLGGALERCCLTQALTSMAGLLAQSPGLIPAVI